MKVSFWAMGCVLVFLAADHQPAHAEEKPGQRLARPLDATMHLLDPVSLTDKDHLANKAKKVSVRVRDKVLIRIQYDPKTVTVGAVDVAFSSRRMVACEIFEVPQKPAKKGEDPVAVLGVIVRATEGKPCTVGVDVKCKDGSVLTLYFPFDIKPKQ